jgi:hypothetical protein
MFWEVLQYPFVIDFLRSGLLLFWFRFDYFLCRFLMRIQSVLYETYLLSLGHFRLFLKIFNFLIFLFINWNSFRRLILLLLWWFSLSRTTSLINRKLFQWSYFFYCLYLLLELSSILIFIITKMMKFRSCNCFTLDNEIAFGCFSGRIWLILKVSLLALLVNLMEFLNRLL